MCTVSMIMDHYGDEWRRRYWPHVPTTTTGPAPTISPFVPTTTTPVVPPFVFNPSVQLPTQQELDEFRRLLERAREYDRRNNEPECEQDQKKRLLKDLAEKLGVDISFVDT